jgi:hypothetical protein
MKDAYAWDPKEEDDTQTCRLIILHFAIKFDKLSKVIGTKMYIFEKNY